MNKIPGFVVAFPLGDREKIKGTLIHDAHDHLTICEQLRFIYDAIHDLPDTKKKDELTELLVDAFMMGKKMVERLSYYKRHYKSDATGHSGSNIKYLLLTRKRKRIRRGRT